MRASPFAAAIALWIVCSVALAALLAYMLRVRRRALAQQSDVDRRLQELAAAAAGLKSAVVSVEMKLDAAQQNVAAQLQTWTERFPADATILTTRHLDNVAVAIRALAQQVGAHPPPADSVALEREALGESWKKFQQNEELSAHVEQAAKDERWKQIGDPLLTHLPKLVPDDLKPTFEAVVAPARQYDDLLRKISLIPKIVNGDIPRLENHAQELVRTRDLAQLLAMSNNGTFVAERMNFRLKNWVVDDFLTFADLYLQRYQQARLENREAALEEGVSIVKRVLRAAAVEPVDVKLGETPFDSSRHVGCSTTSDARYSDGVIVGIVRNGFVEGGSQVIRQPEVVVNRMR